MIAVGCANLSEGPRALIVGGLKVKVRTLDVAPLHSESPPQKCSGMARVLE